MNYFEFHLGDYAEATAHLSLVEDAVYMRLIRKYYASESAMPGSLSETERLVGAKQTSEKRALKRVISEFFYVGPDGLYHNERCDAEIAKYHAFIAKQRAAGLASGARRKGNGGSTSDEHRLNGGSNRLQPNSNPPLPTSHSPPTRYTPPNPLGDEGGPVRKRRSEHRAGLDEARLVWSQLISSGGAKPKRDARIQAALDAVGGWQAVRMRTEHDEVRLQRGFCEAYTAGGESVQKNGAHQSLDPDDVREREEAARADH